MTVVNAVDARLGVACYITLVFTQISAFVGSEKRPDTSRADCNREGDYSNTRRRKYA